MKLGMHLIPLSRPTPRHSLVCPSCSVNTDGCLQSGKATERKAYFAPRCRPPRVIYHAYFFRTVVKGTNRERKVRTALCEMVLSFIRCLVSV